MAQLRKSKLWMTGGIPGLGKSTWIKNHLSTFSGRTKIISRDEIRFSLLKDNEDYFSKEKEVWTEFIKQIKKSLKENDNTIIDATHLNERSRAKVLRAIGADLKNVEINIIFFVGSSDLAIARNKNRTGRSLVPESTIKNMATQVSIPDFNEGFTNIYIIKAENNQIIKRIGE